MKQFTLSFLCALSLLFIIIGCSNDPGKQKAPNFLFVLVDDQSPFDLKTYDPGSILETPNIDRLANEGMVFENACHMGSWIGAVCTPSRHMIMSGRSLWHLPSYREFQNPDAPDSLEKSSMAAVFNKAGYKTMRTCKTGQRPMLNLR